MALDTHPPGGFGHQFRRGHERGRNAERNGSRDHPRHLQHLQGRSQAIHHHLWRVYPERRRRHRPVRDGSEIQAWCRCWKVDNSEFVRIHRSLHVGVFRQPLHRHCGRSWNQSAAKTHTREERSKDRELSGFLDRIRELLFRKRHPHEWYVLRYIPPLQPQH